jgi:PHS family inorganic phosphate transporter-like MFS transporter
MQPVGQALAQLVGLWVLLGFEDTRKLRDLRCGLDTLHEEECRRAVDGIWRIVIGSGAIPALLAIIFRFFLFDCGLYSLEVRNKPAVAIMNTQRVYGTPAQHTPSFPMQDANGHLHAELSPRPMPVQFSRSDLHNFFVRDRNWIYLLGTAATWFFLDVSFYGLSLDNRGTLSDMWATTHPTPINESLSCWNSSLPGGTSTVPSWIKTGLPTWQTDATHPCNTIYDVLIEQTKQYLLTVSLASICGSLCFVVFANRIPRRQWLTASFFILGVSFLITGAIYYGVHRETGAPATVAFVAVCHFMFNFGKFVTVFIFNSNADSSRSKHAHIHNTRRNLSDLLSLHVPWHLGCCWQTRQHRRSPGRLWNQQGVQERDAPGPDLPAIWLCCVCWCILFLGVSARLAALGS